MDHDDFAFEPLPGLPAHPPKGETLLWQGSPATLPLAREAYKLTWVACYFVLVVLWRGWSGYADGGAPMALAYGLPYAVIGLCACGLIVLLAHWQARTAIYTITTARVILRIGAALSVTINLPFKQLLSASLDKRRNGTGTIAMQIGGDTKISYLVCWPHVRPWHLRDVEPALRCIPEAERVARILSNAAEARLSVPSVAPRAAAQAPQGAVPAE